MTADGFVAALIMLGWTTDERISGTVHAKKCGMTCLDSPVERVGNDGRTCSFHVWVYRKQDRVAVTCNLTGGSIKGEFDYVLDAIASCTPEELQALMKPRSDDD